MLEGPKPKKELASIPLPKYVLYPCQYFQDTLAVSEGGCGPAAATTVLNARKMKDSSSATSTRVKPLLPQLTAHNALVTFRKRAVSSVDWRTYRRYAFGGCTNYVEVCALDEH